MASPFGGLTYVSEGSISSCVSASRLGLTSIFSSASGKFLAGIIFPAVISVVPLPLIVPRLYAPPPAVKIPLFAIVPLFVNVLFTVIVFVALFVKVALFPTVILFWLIVPLFVTVTGTSAVPLAISVVPVPLIP